MSELKEFDIDIFKKITYNFTVLAHSYEEAKEKAYEIYEQAENNGTINEYIYDCDVKVDEEV